MFQKIYLRTNQDLGDQKWIDELRMMIFLYNYLQHLFNINIQLKYLYNSIITHD